MSKNHLLEQQKENKIYFDEDRLRELWSNIVHTNFWITGIAEGEG